jgi:hypothetical protein
VRRAPAGEPGMDAIRHVKLRQARVVGQRWLGAGSASGSDRPPGVYCKAGTHSETEDEAVKSTSTIPVLIALLAVVGLAACGSAAQSATYADPFAYCAAVGTVDAPGAEYTGPQVPEDLAQGLQRALDAPDTPLEMLQNGSVWRCVDGRVYACFVGANLPCEAKANTNQTPTQEEVEFCQANPDSDFIPAVVTGRETVYEWRCRAGAPEIVRQVSEVDAQGFIADIWYAISAE